jgi:hypothetical protein
MMGCSLTRTESFRGALLREPGIQPRCKGRKPFLVSRFRASARPGMTAGDEPIVQPGSMPVFLMIGAASGAVRNLSSARPASGAVAALCTPAENTVTSWMSGGSGPR